MARKRVALDAGHGLYTPGKRCLKSIDPNETREWTLNSRITEYIEAMLSVYDVDVTRLDDRTGKTDIPLSKRRDDKADFTMSIHHNAGLCGRSGGGPIVFYWGSPNAASECYKSIVAMTGHKGNRSDKTVKKALQVVRQSKKSSILIECGFMDSPTDTPLILSDAYARNVAMGCVNFLESYLNLRKISTHVPVTCPTCGGTGKI